MSWDIVSESRAVFEVRSLLPWDACVGKSDHWVTDPLASCPPANGGLDLLVEPWLRCHAGRQAPDKVGAHA